MPFSKEGGSLPVIFNTGNDQLHKQLKTPIAPLFLLSSVVTLERFVDQVLDIFCTQLDERFVQTGAVFDFGDWLQFFAFDVMGTLTFSKQYGFLERGRDIGGMWDAIWKFMAASAPVNAFLSFPFL